MASYELQGNINRTGDKIDYPDKQERCTTDLEEK
jgi:hypothetical protein